MIASISVAMMLSAFCGCTKETREPYVWEGNPSERTTYTNPVFEPDLADPTMIRADDGWFYAYGTENTWASGEHRVVPIVMSRDLVSWVYVADAFQSKPNWKADGGIWAPCITKKGGTYYLYYSFSTWGDPNPGIGVATSNTPGGPFEDLGKVFDSNDIGVANSIDPFFYTDESGVQYLFWGSFRGIYGIEIAADMKTTVGDKFKIAGNHFEAAYIYKKGSKYIFFGSGGSCCEGKNSQYHVSVAMSDNLKGPYLTKAGANILVDDLNGTPFLVGDSGNGWVGPGHNGEIITDDAGRDFIIYHAVDYMNPLLPGDATRRPLMLDQVLWDEAGWPYIKDGKPGYAPQKSPIFASSQTAAIELADPCILLENGTYFLYGTGGNVNHGFQVYTSQDLVTWVGPSGASNGYALKTGDTYGNEGFWAPQVFKHSGKFYMAYTANEQLAIAESDSPLGPFVQSSIKKLSGANKQIDPFVFMDGGKVYMYHVRLDGGNKLFVAEMNSDLSDIKPETAKLCIEAQAGGWEDTQNVSWKVAEGPTVIKEGADYFLIYSANDFKNPDYAVGYATSDGPMGNWAKYSGNPILNKVSIGKNGTGHGDLFYDKDGGLKYVFHYHYSDDVVSPRKTAIIDVRFVDNGAGGQQMVFDPNSCKFLYVSK